MPHWERHTGDDVDSFARFIPDGRDLDPAAIRDAGLGARPCPEWASPEEIIAIGRQVGAVRAELWHCEPGREPHLEAGLSLDEAGQRAFDLGYSNVLIVFEAARTCIWQPLEHEFFVIVAPPMVLGQIRSAGIFTYDYDDYAREPYFSGRRSDFLVAAGRRYTINPDRI